MLTFASVKRDGARARQGTPQSAPHPIARETRPQIHRILQTPQIQPKLTVGPPDDEFEHDADRVAEQVMRIPDDGGAPSAIPPPPRIQPICTECEEEERSVQRWSEQTTGHTAPPSVLPVLATAGRPLQAAVREGMEARFGRDFSPLR